MQVPGLPAASPETHNGFPPVPPAAETAANHEQQLSPNIGSWQIIITDRPDFRSLSEADQKVALHGRTSENPTPLATVVDGNHGVYVGTAADAHSNFDRNSSAAETAATTLHSGLDEIGLDGASDNQVRAVFHKATETTDRAVGHGNAGLESDDPARGGASAGVVRLYRDDTGKNKAALFGLGGARILRLREDQAEEIIAPQVSLGGSSLRTLDGNNNRRHDQVEIVDVQRGDRFVVLDTSMHNELGTPINDAHIAKTVKGVSSPDEAAEKICELALHPEGQAARVNMDDITVSVVDALPVSKAQKLAERGKKLLSSALVKIGEVRFGDTVFTLRRNAAVQKADAEYRANPTHANRVRRNALLIGGALLGAGGLYLTYRLGASIHAADVAAHQPHDLPVTMPDGGGSADTGAGAEPGAGTDPSAGTGGEVSQGPAYTLPDGAVIPENLPDGVHVSPEQTAWLHDSTGSGEIGDYSSAATHDGTGFEGTAWHTALDGLKQLGYDPNQMTPSQRHEYVEHVLKLNGLSWEQAQHMGNHDVIHTPSNLDAVKTVTHITGADGHPLTPAHGSIADQHINAIRTEVTAQVTAPGTGGAGGGTGEALPEYGPSPDNSDYGPLSPTVPHTPLEPGTGKNLEITPEMVGGAAAAVAAGGLAAATIRYRRATRGDRPMSRRQWDRSMDAELRYAYAVDEARRIHSRLAAEHGYPDDGDNTPFAEQLMTPRERRRARSAANRAARRATAPQRAAARRARIEAAALAAQQRIANGAIRVQRYGRNTARAYRTTRAAARRGTRATGRAYNATAGWMRRITIPAWVPRPRMPRRGGGGGSPRP